MDCERKQNTAGEIKDMEVEIEMNSDANWSQDDNVDLKEVNIETSEFEAVTSVNSITTVLSKPIPIRPAPSRVVVIQGPSIKVTANASDFAQASNGQIMISTLAQSKLSTTKAVPLTNSIIIPTSNASIISGKSQIMLQAPKPLSNIVPVSVSTANGSKPQFAYLSTIMKPVRKPSENQIVTHLPVGLVPAPTSQKILLKPITKTKLPANLRRLSTDNIPKSISQSKFTNIILPKSTAPNSIIKSKPPVINLKITNGQLQSDHKGAITVLRDHQLAVAKLPPLQPLTKITTVPSSTVTTNCVLKPSPTEKELPSPSTEKEYTLSIPEGNSNFLDADSSFELSIKENSTDTVEVTCTISSNKDLTSPKKDKLPVQEESDQRSFSFLPETPSKKIHEIAILKKPRPFQDADWKKSRTDFVSILERDIKPEVACSEADSVKIVPLENITEKKVAENISDVSKLPEITKTVITERRRKSHNTILKDDDEIEFTSSMSPEFEETPALKYKSSADITFTKLSIRKELATKSKLAVDDIQIELIKKEAPPVELTSEEDFDPAKVLEWNDGIGSLPGSDLKFHMNEFGFMQMVIDGDLERIRSAKKDKSNKLPPKSTKKYSTDIVYCCVVCGCYGYGSEFLNTMLCSYACSAKYVKDGCDSKLKKKDRKLIVIQKKRSQNDIDNNNKNEAGSANATPAQSDDDNTSNDTTQENKSTYPWLAGKKGFSWAKYLTHVNGKSAPVKLFKDAFPYTKNGFKIGMKLEGIDPQHPSHYCVLTVAEVLGYRMRLHFDGYLDKFDFWVNADSLNIFPAGWCDKNNHKLHPPHGYTISSFNWTGYLKQCKAQPAPRNLFLNRPENSPCPNGFRLGMKLEAVDRKNSSLICVATVADIMDNRILVHFDSWDDIYDYWADPTSPYIHPIGWCEEKGHSLTPPNSYKDPDTFTWESYLKEMKAQAAPARAFKQRPPNGFKRGMRLECVDKRIPRFIRVATVDDVRDHQIRVCFDGWPDKYSYWVDDDSHDIHPIGWCQKSGHPIQPPLTPEDIYTSECSIPGCRGWGNAMEPHLEVHTESCACPYSDENFDKDHITDRLIGDMKTEKPNEAVPLSKEPKRHAADSTTVSALKIPRRRAYNCDSDDEWSSNDKIKRKKRKRTQSLERDDSPVNFVQKIKVIPDAALIKNVTQDNFDPSVIPDPDKVTPFYWDKHSKNLSCYVNDVKDPRSWTEHDVVEFISTIPSCRDLSNAFAKHQIDGEALLMLSQHDLVSILGFKLGPAIKLYNSIVLLRQNVLCC